jgi:hypothetical protein
MSYIGRDLRTGAFRQLDDISSGFDGSDTTHTMQVNSTNVSVGDVNQILLSLGGVIQKPGTDFTVSGSTLTFTTAPAANTSFFAILLGSDNGGTVTPTDLSVTTAKIAADAVTSAKIADDAVTGDHIASSGAFAIGATGTASSLAGIPFFSDSSNNSMYTHDVSGTDSTAAGNSAYGFKAMDAITTGDDNTAMGENALSAITTGSNNVGYGKNAIQKAASSGGNVAVGDSALKELTYDGNSYNVAIGHNAGLNLTNAAYNTLVGGFAGDGYDTENHNTAFGYQALGGSVAGGEYNTALGSYTLDALTSGDNNVAVGYAALSAVGSGYDNVAVGQGAALNHTDGQGMVCIGHNAGQTNTTGGSNICIGKSSDVSGSNNAFSIVIGTSISTVSNRVAIGKSGGLIYADFDSSASWTQSSDERLKDDITETDLGLDFINELRPVTFKWKDTRTIDSDLFKHKTVEESGKNTETLQYGLVAQEVKAAMDKVGHDKFTGWDLDEDESQSLREGQFIYPLIKAVKELSAKVKALEEA